MSKFQRCGKVHSFQTITDIYLKFLRVSEENEIPISSYIWVVLSKFEQLDLLQKMIAIYFYDHLNDEPARPDRDAALMADFSESIKDGNLKF